LSSPPAVLREAVVAAAWWQGGIWEMRGCLELEAWGLVVCTIGAAGHGYM
jgi:hypothetical protein